MIQHQNRNHQSKGNNLSEGLRHSDLKDTIDSHFTVDQYESKMGDDKNIIVLRLRAVDKEPATDLMEFIERGFDFVLDSDISSGEEKDGKYSIFVELERNESAPRNIDNLIKSISQLCAINEWKFRWWKDTEGHPFTEEEFAKVVPLNPAEYESKVKKDDNTEVADFFDQGAIDSVGLSEGVITFTRPYASPLTAKFIAIGEYNELKNVLRGAIQLDESSRGQVLYLNKYLGNYDINKIEGQFLIRNGKRAVILQKDRW